jgi:hypothetical protein
LHDRTVRRLTALEKSASTARVLNLLSAHKRMPDDPAMEQAPFFKNRVLNHCIIVKHRVRPNEYELFTTIRPTATKIMAPMDGTDLKAGARYLMVGQKDFDLTAEEMFGDALKPGQPDRDILELVDELPSLDPFLLRELLKRNGHEPARGYFAISDADVAAMYEFVRREVSALVNMADNDESSGRGHAAKLVDKLLSSSPDSMFEPLKLTLKLNDRDYQDGIFCWRGFLYYKWVLDDITPKLAKVAKAIEQTMPRGARSEEANHYLPQARKRLLTAITKVTAHIQSMLSVYDNAYLSMTRDGKPMAFRDFLLSAPEMFMQLGEQLGAIQHVVSFWAYRFPAGRPAFIDADELMDVFLDFEDSVAFLNDPPEPLAYAANG